MAAAAAAAPADRSPRPGTRRTRRRLRAGAVLTGAAAAALVLAPFPGGAGAGAAPARAASGPVAEAVGTPAPASAALCGSAAGSRPPATYQHVVWIWMENHSLRQVVGAPGSTAYADAPYLNGTVARQCGLATNYHNITSPSLPNYLAAVSGTTGGVTTDCTPASCPQSARTLFQQVLANGKTWRSYAESMPSACYLSNTTLYAARHNPAVYYPAMRTACRSYDVAMGSTSSGRFEWATRTGNLPAFAFVTPNLCHDMHDCSIRTGDDWLAAWLPRIVASPAYQRGSTAVFVTWDEGEHTGTWCAYDTTHPGCRVATFVLSRWTRPGTRSSVLFNHYGLLRTTEDLLGLPVHLGHAGDPAVASMRAAFHL